LPWISTQNANFDCFKSVALIEITSKRGYPNLAAYVARGEARPAYQRAFDAQLAVFTGQLP
jgi:glutathione S-transferase